MDHHHHHQHNGMLMTSTESNPSSSSTVGEELAQHHGQHNHHHGHHTMTFQLWTSSKLLVEAWPLDSLQGLVAAMVFSAFLSVVYEGSKFYYHIGKILHHKQFDRWRGTMVAHYVSRMWKALAYMIHFLIGYVLMLCSMTYSVWILVAVCLGSGVGYFFLLPLIQHVLHRNTDHETHDSISSFISHRNKRGKSNSNKSIYSKLDSDEDLSGSRNNILFQQISNLEVQVMRETVL